nr:unnamed protein product [Spirometra erinaceieuropaei]
MSAQMYSVVEFINDESVTVVAKTWFYDKNCVMRLKNDRRRNILLERNEPPPSGTKEYLVRILKDNLTLSAGRRLTHRAEFPTALHPNRLFKQPSQPIRRNPPLERRSALEEALYYFNGEGISSPELNESQNNMQDSDDTLPSREPMRVEEWQEPLPNDRLANLDRAVALLIQHSARLSKKIDLILDSNRRLHGRLRNVIIDMQEAMEAVYADCRAEEQAHETLNVVCRSSMLLQQKHHQGMSVSEYSCKKRCLHYLIPGPMTSAEDQAITNKDIAIDIST